MMRKLAHLGLGAIWFIAGFVLAVGYFTVIEDAMPERFSGLFV